LSVVSFQLSVFSCQFSVFDGKDIQLFGYVSGFDYFCQKEFSDKTTAEAADN
jgi:hypothetical protein